MAFLDELNRFLAALRSKESGGNYRAVGAATRYGKATGAYQFLDSTWGGFKGFKRAADAPPEIQDERARQLVSQYYKRFQDWRKVAMAWYAGPGFEKKNLTAKQKAAGGKQFPSIADYGDDVVRRMGKQATRSRKQPVTEELAPPAVTYQQAVQTMARVLAVQFAMPEPRAHEMVNRFAEEMLAEIRENSRRITAESDLQTRRALEQGPEYRTALMGAVSVVDQMVNKPGSGEFDANA